MAAVVRKGREWTSEKVMVDRTEEDYVGCLKVLLMMFAANLRLSK